MQSCCYKLIYPHITVRGRADGSTHTLDVTSQIKIGLPIQAGQSLRVQNHLIFGADHLPAPSQYIVDVLS